MNLRPRFAFLPALAVLALIGCSSPEPGIGTSWAAEIRSESEALGAFDSLKLDCMERHTWYGLNVSRGYPPFAKSETCVVAADLLGMTSRSDFALRIWWTESEEVWGLSQRAMCEDTEHLEYLQKTMLWGNTWFIEGIEPGNIEPAGIVAILREARTTLGGTIASGKSWLGSNCGT